MRIVKAGRGVLQKEINALKSKVGALQAPITRRAMDLTRRVFGKPLTPSQVVKTIIREVRKRGDDALIEFERKLDGVSLTRPGLRVSPEEMAEAAKRVPRPLLKAFRRARKNIAAYQQHIKPKEPTSLKMNGAALDMRLVPLRRVGVYIPGGSAPYPSSVLMTVIPAQIAGVEEIAVATPPRRDGKVTPEILAVLKDLGVHEVYKLGGAPAIAALAFGTRTVLPVDKIVGPGNVFVNLAKREVYGTVDIDMFAGPSEIVIIADGSASASCIAADLLSQAEHDAGSAVLVCTSEKFAKNVLEEVEKQVGDLRTRDTARESLEQFGLIIVTKQLKDVGEIVNLIAPEHLEIVCRQPRKILSDIKNAGAVFLGKYAPVPVGDYVAGPSHVLPTGGAARFSSGLSVYDFLRCQSVITYSRKALEANAEALYMMAASEGFDAHMRAVRVRLQRTR